MNINTPYRLPPQPFSAYILPFSFTSDSVILAGWWFVTPLAAVLIILKYNARRNLPLVRLLKATRLRSSPVLAVPFESVKREEPFSCLDCTFQTFPPGTSNYLDRKRYLAKRQWRPNSPRRTEPERKTISHVTFAYIRINLNWNISSNNWWLHTVIETISFCHEI